MLDALDGIIRHRLDLERRTYTRRAPRAQARVSRPLILLDDETARLATMAWCASRPAEEVRAALEELGIDSPGSDPAARLAEEHLAGTSAVMSARSRGAVPPAAAMVRAAIDETWALTKEDWRGMIHG